MPFARAEPVEGLGVTSPLDAVGDVFPERGAMLEAVPRAAADEPPGGRLGVL